MRRHYLFAAIGVLLLLISQPARASDQGETPAILAALDPTNLITLDDAAIAGIRGQAPDYVLVKVIGVNALDFGPASVKWTWNPLNYRYGNWGGPGWGTGDPAVDTMDGLFQQHDQGDISDTGLLSALDALSTTAGISIADPNWGTIYYDPFIALPTSGVPRETNNNDVASIRVSGVSLLGSRFFWGWKPMVYPEYSRREAVAGLTAYVFANTFFPVIMP